MCKINLNLTSDYFYNWKLKIFNNRVNHKFLRCNNSIVRGYKLYCIDDNSENRRKYNEYKKENIDLFVELRVYNKIIRMLKKISRE